MLQGLNLCRYGVLSLKFSNSTSNAWDKLGPSHITSSQGAPNPGWNPNGLWPHFLPCGTPYDPLSHVWSQPDIPKSSRTHVYGIALGPHVWELVTGEWSTKWVTVPGRWDISFTVLYKIWLQEWCWHTDFGCHSLTWEHEFKDLSYQLFLSDHWVLPAYGALCISSGSTTSSVQNQREMRVMAEISYPAHPLPLTLTLWYICSVSDSIP